MTIIEHVQHKAKKYGFIVVPTLGGSYVLCRPTIFNAMCSFFAKGSLYKVNAVLNHLINERCKLDK